MGFSYTKFHIFDKSGTELPLNYNSNIKVVIPNQYGDDGRFFGITDVSGNLVDFMKITSGGRFDASAMKPARVFTMSGTNDVSIYCNLSEQVSTDYDTYYINSIDYDQSQWIIDESDLTYPSITFSSNISFDKVSTELVETQSLYILVETRDASGNIVYDTPYNVMQTDSSLYEWSQRFQLMYFIDCRTQKDFRLFDVNNDQVVWSDRKFLNLNDEDSFRINVGFSGENEGVYEQSLYICVVDTYNKVYPDDPGYVYPIGEFKMSAETEGEDERYRTLFTNFGIPDPALYNNVFNDEMNLDDKTDNISLNKHSKKVFLSYPEIFPYVGTYKALINAVNMLGYDDIFFKEWYKEIGVSKNTHAGYVSYDMTYHADPDANTINNLPIEERIRLKKLNWLSMMYHINEELYSAGIDKFGFPTAINKYNYYNTDSIVKLISLRQWLEKYIVGLNCRIIDVGGEGVYFERYKLDSYGGYQRVMEFGESKNIAPVIREDGNVIRDCSAYIKVGIEHTGNTVTFEDLSHMTFQDFCNGYLDASFNYHIKSDSNIIDSSITVCTSTATIWIDTDDDDIPDTSIDGSTFFDGSIVSDTILTGLNFDNFEDNNRYQINAQVETENFIFNNDFLDENSPWIRVHNNQVEFNNIDLISKDRNSAFTNLPLIQIERANLKVMSNSWDRSVKYRIYPDIQDDTTISYIIENTETNMSSGTIDYVTFIPPTYTHDQNTVFIKPYKGQVISRGKKYCPAHVADDIVPDAGRKYNPEYYHKKIYQNVTTYGLRYSTDNDYGIPNFSILGYQIETDTSIFDAATEYILEIYDGKMIFNDDVNNRRVYLNFTYNDETGTSEISANVIYSGDPFYAMTYCPGDASAFYHFMNGSNYEKFVNMYKTEPENSVSYNYDHDLKVHNSGKYNIDVLCMDQTNAIYAANADRLATVNVAEPHLTALSNHSNSNNEFNMTGKDVSIADAISGYERFCIYDYKYQTPFVYTDSSNMTFSYPVHAYNTNLPNNDNIAHFINTKDRFQISNIDNIIGPDSSSAVGGPYEFFLTARKVNCGDSERFLSDIDTKVLEKIWKTSDFAYNVDTMLKIIQNMPDDPGYLDVNLIFYNELGNYPVMQCPAKMMCPKATNNERYTVSDEYHIYLVDSSSYWDNRKDHYNDILSFISDPNISVYAHPTWEIPIKITKVFADVSNNFIFINNTDSLFEHAFKPGEMVRMKYQDVGNENYYSYSTYKVIGYDSLGKVLKLSGIVNKAYITGNTKTKVYADLDASDASILEQNIEYGVTGDDTELLTWRDTTTTMDASTIFTYYDSSSGQNINYKIPARIPNITEPNKIIYQTAYFFIDSSGDLAVDFPWIEVEELTNTSIYLSYAHHAYVDYPMQIVDNSINIVNSIATVGVENNIVNKMMADYIDDTFCLIYRDFDINNGIEMWMDNKDGIPVIADSSIYEYHRPITVTDSSSNVAFKIDFVNCGMDASTSTVSWKVYKRLDEYNNRELLFESYNKVLFIDTDKPGIYDIEADVYDKNGNTAHRMFNGAYTIKKSED